MKKIIKKVLITLFIIISCIVLFFVWLFSDHHWHIKTEYGDSFTLTTGFLDNHDEHIFRDDNSDFTIISIVFHTEEDIIPVCDTAYFRCYRLKNDKEDVYIFKLKPDGEFHWLKLDWNETGYFEGDLGEEFKSVLLADKYIMEMFLPYMDDAYYDEVKAMAEKFVARDFEGLDKYGLADDMINDEAGLNEKIAIMENYLKECEKNHALLDADKDNLTD